MSSEKSSGSAVVRELVASVAGPRNWSDTRESWLARAARRAGISYRQAKALFYAEITDPNHRSARLMRDAAEKYEAIASSLNHNDAEFFGSDIAALLDLARRLRDSAADAGREPHGQDQSGMAAADQNPSRPIGDEPNQ